MVFHLAAAADDEALLRVLDAVAGAAGQLEFFQNVDVLALHLSVTDQEAGRCQRGQAAAHQISALAIHALRLLGTGEGFIITIGIIHTRQPPYSFDEMSILHANTGCHRQKKAPVGIFTRGMDVCEFWTESGFCPIGDR